MNDDRGTQGQNVTEPGGPARPGGAGDQGFPPVPPGGTAQAAPARPGRRRRKSGRSWWIELPILLVFALVLALVLKTFVVQAFYIPSQSMEKTLDVGDKVLVNKLVYDFRPIHRGDVIVFNGDGSWDRVPPPRPPLARLWDAISGLFGTAPGVHDYIKRVIGIPGDHVACCTNHRVTVNGVPLREASYLYPGNAPSAQRFSITVPPGRLWVMGDHREVSADSRYHVADPGHGTIPENHVVGRAFLIIAPVSRWRILPIPATFSQPRLAASAALAAGAPPVPAAALDAAAPAAPAPPAVLGLIAAVPLTWLQRRVRLRLAAPGRERRLPALARQWLARVRRRPRARG
jgi:signal peptidase I